MQHEINYPRLHIDLLIAFYIRPIPRLCSILMISDLIQLHLGIVYKYSRRKILHIDTMNKSDFCLHLYPYIVYQIKFRCIF